MGIGIAIVGATGNVGREMLNVLDESDISIEQVFAVASNKSKGKTVKFGRKNLTVEDLSEFDFSKVDIALFSAGGTIAEKYAPLAAKENCIVIDNSSRFRMDDDVPLVVPEVNVDAIKGYKKRNIIANPNCSTIQMVVALHPLRQLANITRIVVSTYNSTSGAGKEAMDELFQQTKGIFSNNEIEPKIFQKQIAFNVIPQIGAFDDNGYSDEENKMINETKKILSSEIEVTATCVRVPTFIGHAESVNVEFDKPISIENAIEVLKKSPGCEVQNYKENDYITPIDCVGDDMTFISRIRKDESVDNALNLWVVSDNLRKGAALNTVQISEILIREYLT